MGIPFELAILQRITTCLEGINPDNVDPNTEQPYEIDLRGKVFRGRLELGQEVQPPMLAILERPDPSEFAYADQEYMVGHGYWWLFLQGFAKDDKTNPSDPAYWFKAIVIQRLSRLSAVDNFGELLFPDEAISGSLVDAMKVGQGVVRGPAKTVSPTAFFYVPIGIELTTDTANPYVEA